MLFGIDYLQKVPPKGKEKETLHPFEPHDFDSWSIREAFRIHGMLKATSKQLYNRMKLGGVPVPERIRPLPPRQEEPGSGEGPPSVRSETLERVYIEPSGHAYGVQPNGVTEAIQFMATKAYEGATASTSSEEAFNLILAAVRIRNMTGGDTLNASGTGVVSILDGRYVCRGMYFDTYSRPTESMRSALITMQSYSHFHNGDGDLFIHEHFTDPPDEADGTMMEQNPNPETEEEEPEAGPEQGGKEEEASDHPQGGSGWGTGECVVRTGWWGPPPSTVDVPQPNQNESGQTQGWTTGWGSTQTGQGWGVNTPALQRTGEEADKADLLETHDEEGQDDGAK